jgi:cytidyltransferase-like protein
MPATIYVDGVFDLFHAGHVAYLRQCRELLGVHGATRLLVGVVSDEDAASYKRTPVLTLAERAEVVEACSLVDEVLRAAPLVLTEEFLCEREVVRVVHGDDDRQSAFFHVPLRLGIMSYVPYTQGISTSEIIARVSSRREA